MGRGVRYLDPSTQASVALHIERGFVQSSKSARINLRADRTAANRREPELFGSPSRPIIQPLRRRFSSLPPL